MKKLFFALILLSSIVSCNSGTDQSAQDTGGAASLNETPALIHQFKPLINGVWVKKDYFKKIRKSKSPIDAMPKATGITLMYIDTAKLKGDSIPVPALINNNKSSSLELRFAAGKNTTTIVLGDSELSYSLKNGDTTLIVYQYDQATKETTTAKYTKAMQAPPATDMTAVFNYIINQSIIAGVYQAADAAGRKFDLNFSADGKVSGLPGFSTYYIHTDLAATPDKEDNEIIFNQDGKNKTAYIFEMKKRKGALYSIKKGGNGQLSKDRQLYKLVKKR